MKKFIYTIALVLSASALFVACGKKGGGGSGAVACTPTYNYGAGYTNYNTAGCNGYNPNTYGAACPANYGPTSYNSCCPAGQNAPAGQNGCIAIQGNGSYPFGNNGYQGYYPGNSYYYTQPMYYPQPYYPNYNVGFYIGFGI